MEMPTPDEHHEKLSVLAGRWVGEETMYPSPWDPTGGRARGFIEARMDLHGMFLVSDYRQERGGAVTYRGHGVYGWDPSAKTYTMYWFDSMGYDPGGAARGAWDGDTLRLEMRSGTGFSRYAIHFHGRDRYDFTIEMSSDGSRWSRWLDSTWSRSR